MIELLIPAAVIVALFGLVVFLLLQLKWEREGYDERYTAWDIERGRYVAALLAKQNMGDGVAASVVRPRPQSGPVRSEEPKPIQEGM